MKKHPVHCLLLAALLLLPPPLAAQSAGPRGRAAQPEPASVTFTFNSPCDDCATQGGAGGDSRYFIDVPISNNPSPAKSGSTDDLSMEVEVRPDRLVYGIRFRPGTSPRAVWRAGGKVLQVFFVPPAPPAGGESARLAPAAPPADDAAGEAVADSAAASVSGPLVASGARAALVSAPAPALTPASPAPPPAAAPAQQGAAAGLQPLNAPLPAGAGGSADFVESDLSVPESPAFTVLGLTPQTVVRPTSPRQFASSLLSGVDANGNFQSGLALDLVPYLAFAGDELSLTDYRGSYLTRLLARTQFSFATTKGASDDDKSMRLALGFHATLWDRGDPRTDMNLQRCLEGMQLPAPRTQTEPELLGTTPEELRAFNEAVERFNADNARFERDRQAAIEFNNAVSTRCREQSRRDNWNRSSWIVAAAPSWISQTGETKNYEWNGGGFWTSVAYGFEGVPGLRQRSQLIMHARYRNREQIADPDDEGEFITRDSAFFGARFRHGSPTFNGSFEYTFINTRPVGGSFDGSHRLALGLERRIAGDTWFNLALGGESGRTDGRNSGFVLTSFKWAFSGRRDVTPPPPPDR